MVGVERCLNTLNDLSPSTRNFRHPGWNKSSLMVVTPFTACTGGVVLEAFHCGLAEKCGMLRLPETPTRC